MKRNLLFTMGAMLLMAGTVTTACSSDDDVITPTEQTAELDAATKGDGTQLPDAADFIKTVSDTGYVHSYFDEGFWYVKASLPEEPGVIYYDGGICYFMYNLPEDFKIDGKIPCRRVHTIYRQDFLQIIFCESRLGIKPVVGVFCIVEKARRVIFDRFPFHVEAEKNTDSQRHHDDHRNKLSFIAPCGTE